MARESCGTAEMRRRSLIWIEILRAAEEEATLDLRVDSAAANRAALKRLRTFQGLAPRAGGIHFSELRSLRDPLRNSCKTGKAGGEVVEGKGYREMIREA
jgi:hypothetical protein